MLEPRHAGVAAASATAASAAKQKLVAHAAIAACNAHPCHLHGHPGMLLAAVLLRIVDSQFQCQHVLKQKSWSGRSAALESKLQILQCDNAITECNQAKADNKTRTGNKKEETRHELYPHCYY